MPTELTAKIGTKISEPVARRLRLAAAVTGTEIGRLIDSALDRCLPTPEQLATAVQGGAADEQR